MKTMFLITLFLLGASATLQAQDKDAEAITYYTNAEEYFNRNTLGGYDSCLRELEKAEKILETSNSKILYLKIRAMNEDGKITGYYTDKMDSALTIFFKITDAKKYPIEKYSEIVTINDFYKQYRKSHNGMTDVKNTPQIIIDNYLNGDLSKYSKAYFAAGCFWHEEALFESVKGVKEAISGYAGGTTQNPTYESVETGNTGHAESVEVYYDPSQISYETLLKVYFAGQNPV